MKWRNQPQSDNVEDIRGGGMGRALPIGGGIGTLVLAAIVYFMGGDPSAVLQQNPGNSNTSISRSGNSEVQSNGSGQNDEAKQFVSVVLADTEDTWSKFFEQRGQKYRKPKLVLFSGQVRSACGVAGDSAGPFYCPNDQKLYIDLAFFNELKTRFGAPGDFAQAYVIAHEVGHHVQNQMGTMSKVQALQSRGNEAQSNQLSVRLELQADFYAGVWAHYAKRKGLVETGDIEEALNAASAVGDDRLQRETRGYVVPDSFTHGTSQQRVEWFQRGLSSGDLKQANTFGPGFN
ncbi:hypothetical protein B1R32_11160 [Abditibacterium utsteinense]|uniref:Metalloprotease n=1 Tax=Abditibacterium utsteinense TaxID=1960156 RepID=A0A2S8SRY0_9BACT|nr:neutral zinc metallopeptidase [Abditibacterium utsteinense]PQV63499.1 hypothetical protein B1R32_11160 [Abditibacterium utsteinense]